MGLFERWAISFSHRGHRRAPQSNVGNLMRSLCPAVTSVAIHPHCF
jgi:hypothetical protein